MLRLSAMKRKQLSFEELKEGILSGNRILLSRAITICESQRPQDIAQADELLQSILPQAGNSLRIGITGVPGVGKSTFIESFGELITEKGKKLAVLTIDPSSQKTKGSILGDKTRMEELARNPNAFIRPSASGSALGGVGYKTREVMLLCEAAGFDVIIVETVGVGQSETLVHGMVDFFLLLMLAGAGDELQGIKKGIMEMAHALVINKADGENIRPAKRAKAEYQSALHLFPMEASGWLPQVKTCSSLEKAGLEEVWQMMLDYEDKLRSNGHFQLNRKTQQVSWFKSNIQLLLESGFYQAPQTKDRLDQLLVDVEQGNIHALKAAHDLVYSFLKK